MIFTARGARKPPNRHAVACARFEANQRLAFFAVRRWFPLLPQADKDDVLSVAYIGLWKACNYYRPDTGFAFSSYATRCMQNEFKREGFWRGEQRRQGTDYATKTRGGADDAPGLVSTETSIGDDMTLLDLIADEESDPLAVVLRQVEMEAARERYDALPPSTKVRCRGWGEELSALGLAVEIPAMVPRQKKRRT